MRKFQGLCEGFLQSVKDYPDAYALCIGNKKWTYKELEKKAGLWASCLLKALHPHKPARIGIFAYRSEVSYISVLTALFAGCTFVPLNPKFPALRTKDMIKQADLDAIIVDADSVEKIKDILEENSDLVILLPESDGSILKNFNGIIISGLDLEKEEARLDHPVVTDNEVAYLLFTSGTTGTPKGVPITQTNVMHFLNFNRKRYQLTVNDRLSQTFDQTFDLSVFDIFMAWHSGACLYVIKPMQLLAPIGFIQENQITVWFSVPSVINLLLKRNSLKPDILPNLRFSLFCGEALRKDAVETWQVAAPNSVIENLYGPTELTIACAVYRWDRKNSSDECNNEIVPIGQLYENHHGIVVDENLHEVGNGSVGELCVTGEQLFPGYWNNEVETAKKFFKAIGEAGVERLYYRTGDAVFLSNNGNYIYIGRIDHQIKVGGYRVELSEIEAVLRKVSGVDEAIACGWPIDNNKNYEGIIAYIIGDANVDQILSTARKYLPFYMTPRFVQYIEKIPLNQNGKIDRKLLHLEAIQTQEKKEVA